MISKLILKCRKQPQSRSIYLKGTDLDKKEYNKETAENELQLQYYENYINTESLTPEEFEKVQNEYFELKNKLQKTKQEGLLLNTEKMREIFENMTVIDSNPNSKRAQEYYKNLEELERKNTNKKPSQVLIRTMKRNGKSVLDKIEIGENGEPLSPEDTLFKRKNVDFTQYKWPEVNKIQYKRKDLHSDKMLHIQNYRWPAQGEKKGSVQFIVGYGDYVGRYSYLANQFAQEGYDFIGIDARGFGHSEGKRGIYENQKIIIEDQLEFSNQYSEPLFILSHSLGSLIGLSMITDQPKTFNGITMVAPALKMSEKLQHRYESFKPLALAKSIVDPLFKFSNNKGEVKKWFRNWTDDPLYTGADLPVHNLMLQEKYREITPQIQQPFLMVLAGQEKVVCNKTNRKFFEESAVKDKDIVEFEDAEHEILQDAEYWPSVTRDIIYWQNTHR